MAKRPYPPKRRDHKTGQSPYAKYEKTPYKYSWERNKDSMKRREHQR